MDGDTLAAKREQILRCERLLEEHGERVIARWPSSEEPAEAWTYALVQCKEQCRRMALAHKVNALRRHLARKGRNCSGIQVVSSQSSLEEIRSAFIAVVILLSIEIGFTIWEEAEIRSVS